MAAIDKRRGLDWIADAYALGTDAYASCAVASRLGRRALQDFALMLLNGGLWPRVAVAAVVAFALTLPGYLAQSAARPPQPVVQPAPVLTTAKVDRLDAYARETQIEDTITAATAAAGESSAFDWSSASRRISTHTVTGANGERTYAIRVTVPEGTPVRAAAAGVVEFSGDATDGHGNKVVLRHGAVTTIYAHASELLVKAGDRVRKGQVIAKSGQTGFATTPRLYLAIVSSDPGIDPIAFFSGSVTGKTTERCADPACDDRKPAAKNGVSSLAPRKPVPPVEVPAARATRTAM